MLLELEAALPHGVRALPILQTVDGPAHPRLQPSFPTSPGPPPDTEEGLWGQEGMQASGPGARRGHALKCRLQLTRPMHIHSDRREGLLFPEHTRAALSEWAGACNG